MGGPALPWEGSRSEGWQLAWWNTVKDISFKPDRSLRGVGRGDVRNAVAFGVLTQCIGYVIYLPFQFVGALLDPAVGDEDRPFMLVVFSVLLLTLPLWILLGMVISSVLLHPFLRAVGGQGDFDATLRAMAYSSAPQTFYAIPCFGPLVGGALSIVCFVYAQKHAHSLPGLRVVLAWLLLGVASLLLVSVIAGFVFLVAQGFS
jgi:hypothetical protein